MSTTPKRHKKPSVKDEPIDVDELAGMSNMKGMLSFLDTKPEVYAKLFQKIDDSHATPQAIDNNGNLRPKSTVPVDPESTVIDDSESTVIFDPTSTILDDTKSTVPVDPGS